MGTVVLIIGAALLGVGLLLLMSGLRGTTVDGVKKRKPGLAVIGLILLAPVVVVGARIGMVITGGEDINTIKPTWWLARDAVSDDFDTIEFACEVLLERIKSKDIGGSELNGVWTHIIARQPTAGDDWPYIYEMTIDAGRKARMVPEDVWKEYARNKLALKLINRARVTLGDDIPVRIGHTTREMGYASSTLRFETTLVSYAIGSTQTNWNGVVDYYAAHESKKKKILTDVKWHIRGADGVIKGILPTTGPEDLGEIAPGKLPTKLAMKAKSFDLTDGDKLLEEWDLNIESTVEIVAADQPSTKLIMDESLLQSVRETLDVRAIGISDDGTRIRLRFGATCLTPICYAMSLKVGGKEQFLTHLYSEAEEDAQQDLEIEGLKLGDKVDFVLRPDPEKAAESIHLTEIYGREIVIEGREVVTWDEANVGAFE